MDEIIEAFRNILKDIDKLDVMLKCKQGLNIHSFSDQPMNPHIPQAVILIKSFTLQHETLIYIKAALGQMQRIYQFDSFV